MKLDFIDYSLVGLNCPYFTGVKDHGQKLTLDFNSSDMCYYFQTFGEGRNSIHIHQDGIIYSTEMNYNSRAEEWEEIMTLDLTHDYDFRVILDDWLKENPLYRSHSFPYRVSTRQDFFGSDKICDSLDSLINYLKTY